MYLSQQAGGLLVKCCVSNSSHSFQVILIKLAPYDPFDV